MIVVILLAFVSSRDKRQNRLTPLAGLAFTFIIAGILFGENRILGYGLMGVGVLMAVIDIFINIRSK
jgi:hypothetical protein